MIEREAPCAALVRPCANMCASSFGAGGGRAELDRPGLLEGGNPYEARARREPQLAVLSVMAHGRGKVATAAAIGVAAAKAVSRLPEEQRLLYSLLIQANLSDAARKAIEMQPGLVNFFSEAQRRNYERGRAEGKAEAVLKILMRRGLTLTAAQRCRIVACTDLATLERWLDRSLSAGSVEELLASPSRASGNGHRRSRSAATRGRRKSR